MSDDANHNANDANGDLERETGLDARHTPPRGGTGTSLSHSDDEDGRETDAPRCGRRRRRSRQTRRTMAGAVGGMAVVAVAVIGLIVAMQSESPSSSSGPIASSRVAATSAPQSHRPSPSHTQSPQGHSQSSKKATSSRVAHRTVSSSSASRPTSVSPPTDLPKSASTSSTLASTHLGTVTSTVYFRNQVIALMYHAVDQRKLPGDVITPSTFAQELQLFRKDGFHVVTLAETIAFLHGAPIPPNAVLITFDNGYESFYRTVYPLLQKYHDPATLFAIIRWLSPPQRKGLFTSLTWSQVETMSKSGLVTVMPQTYNLHHAVAISSTLTSPATVGRPYNPATRTVEATSAYDAHILHDVERARADLVRHLQESNVNAMSYPFGDYTSALDRLLHEAGYRYLFTASYGWGILRSTNPNTLYRLDAGSPTFSAQGLIWTIKWIASQTTANPGWHAPNHYVQVWKG